MESQGIRDAASAFAAIALAAVACDGELSATEAMALREQLEHRQPFCDRSDQEMASLLDALLHMLRADGVNALVESAVPLLTPIQQETVLAVAASLIWSDRLKKPAEQAFLSSLVDLLDLDAQRSQLILDVVSLLYRDCLIPDDTLAS